MYIMHLKRLIERIYHIIYIIVGRVGQSVTYLTADTCLTVDPGVASLVPCPVTGCIGQ